MKDTHWLSEVTGTAILVMCAYNEMTLRVYKAHAYSHMQYDLFTGGQTV
jgi:hypothetical protein